MRQYADLVWLELCGQPWWLWKEVAGGHRLSA